MNLSEEAMIVMQMAAEYAKDKGYEYVTPEMILLMILTMPDFVAAYENCGGDPCPCGIERHPEQEYPAARRPSAGFLCYRKR